MVAEMDRSTSRVLADFAVQSHSIGTPTISPWRQLRSGFSWVHAIAIQVRQATQVLAAYFRISSKIFQVRLKSKLFFSTFRMTNEMQIWIDRHRVGISRKEAQLRQISDLFFRNPPPTNRLSNLISRQRVV